MIPLPAESQECPTRIPDELLGRYYRRVPRYTSYPPASIFTDEFGPEDYSAALGRAGDKPDPLSLYVHLPFCEKLCLYCGCNVIVTRHRNRADEYLDWVEKEAAMVSEALGRRPVISSLHLGGGSPNFLTEPQLERLMGIIDRTVERGSDCDQALEVFPAGTSPSFLEAARRHGFKRVSLGVQDLDPSVLKLVARASEGDVVRELTALGRELGFESINFDLMYGLPGQSETSFLKSIGEVIEISPDRIALFGYAHVPWMRKAQRALPEDQMPSPEGRAAILVTARNRLIEAGYVAIGLDHFAKPGDPLTLAAKAGTLHRNFQGYCAEPPRDLVGLGASAISSIENTYSQNYTALDEYRAATEAGKLPVARGLILAVDDQIRRDVIMEVMCAGGISYEDFERKTGEAFQEYFRDSLGALGEMQKDGLLTQDERGFRATNLGMILLRNIAAAFDGSPAASKGSFSI